MNDDLTSVNHYEPGSTPISYDAAGNITQDKKFRLDFQGNGMDYTYDANGRQLTAKRTDNTSNETSVYDCVGQRVQTSANNITRQMVYDISGQLVADYKGSSLERENIYRGGQLLAVYEPSTTCYKTLGNFVADFYIGAFGSGATTTYATEIANWTALLQQAQSRSLDALFGEAQRMGNSVFTSSNYTSPPGTSDTQYVTDLYQSYLQRNPDDPPDNNMSGRDWWVDQFNHGNTRTGVRQAFAVSTEFVSQIILSRQD